MNIGEEVKADINLNPPDSNQKIQNDGQTSNASNVHSLSDNAFGDSAPEDDAIDDDDSVDAWNDCFSSNSSFSDSEASVSFSRIKALQKKTPRRPSFAVFHPERRFECEFCNNKFLKLSHLKRHEGTHDSKNPFECTQCEQICPTKDDLDIHFKIHEMGAIGIDSTNKPPSFHCQICNKKYSSRKSFNWHVKSIHKPKNLHRCFVCRKEFTDEKNLSNHLKVHVGRYATTFRKIKYDCESCGKVFKRGSTLNRHMKIHGEKEFECAYCNVKYHHKWTLTQHLKLHQSSDHDGFKKDIKKFVCVYCGKKFLKSFDLSTHKKMHTGDKSYECWQCNAKYVMESCLVKHMKIHEEQRNTNSNTTNIDGGSDVVPMEPEKKFQCKECDQKFKYLYTLERHRKRHEMFKSFLQTNSNESFECSHCNLHFTNSDSLIKHLKFHVKQKKKREPRNFTPEWKKKHKCEICDKKFVNMFKLKTHRMTHTDEQPFSCSQCNTKYKAKKSLIRHIETHHPNFALEEMNRKIINQKSSVMTNKEFCCDVCGKKFKQSWKLKIHKRVHTGERPFECSICKKTYTMKVSLKKHSKTCGNKTAAKFNLSYLKRKYKCEICAKRFIQLKHLKNHRTTHTLEQPFDCPHCHSKFSRKDSLARHVKNHERNKVSGSIGSESINEVSNEIVSNNTSELVERDIETHKVENPYNCSQCFMKLANKEELDVHFTIHEPNHKEMEVLETVHPKTTVPETEFSDLKHKYKCDYCNKRFVKVESLIIHRRLHTGEKPYECLLCNQKFSRKENLKYHIMIHGENATTDLKGIKSGSINEITPNVDYLVCDWDRCGRRFLNYYDFIPHTAIHLKEYKFQCSFGSNIKTPSHLMGHIETSRSMDSNSGCDKENVNQIFSNTSDFNWKCYSFVSQLSITETKSNFIEKKIKSEIKKTFKCECCGIEFSQLWNLKRHVLNNKKNKGYTLVSQSNEVLNKISTDNFEMIQRGTQVKMNTYRTSEREPRKKRYILDDDPTIKNEIKPRTIRRTRQVDYREPSSDEMDFESEANDDKNTLSINKSKILCVCDWTGCGRRFINYSDFVSHTANHTKEYRFQCSFGSNNVQQLSHLMGHIETSSSFKKNKAIQNDAIITGSEIKTIATNLKTIATNLKTKNSMVIHSCQECDLCFTSSKELKTHEKVSHNSVSDYSTDTSWSDGSVTHYKKKSRITRRIRQVEYYVCDWEGCGRSFLILSDFICHTKIHTKEFRFLCSFRSNNVEENPHLLGHLESTYSLENRINQNRPRVIFSNRETLANGKTRSKIKVKNCRLKIEDVGMYEYSCHECDLSFYSRKELRTHKRLSHNPATDNSSDESSSSALNRRRKPRTTRNTRKMDYRDPSSDEMETKPNYNHKTLITNKCQNYCVCDWEGCGRRFLNYSDFLSHTKIHTKEYRFQCSFGSNGIKNLSHFMGHVETVSSLDDQVNHNKVSTISSNRELRVQRLKLASHERLSNRSVKNKFQCKICKKKFNNAANLYRHRVIHTDEKPFECSQCDKKYAWQQGLYRHILRDHPFKKRVSKKYGTKTTKKKSNIMVVKNKFQCKICKRIFINSRNLYRHSVVHTGEKPFECSYCDKKYPWHQSLHRHVAKYHPYEKLVLERNASETINESSSIMVKNKLQCKICKKIFSSNGNLKRHRVIHTSETPFECSQCDQKYPWQQSLDRHIAKDHPYKKPVWKRNASETINESSNIMLTDYCSDSTASTASSRTRKRRTTRCTLQVDYGEPSSDEIEIKPNNYSKMNILETNKSQNHWICDWEGCSRRFLNYSDFLSHTTIHTREYRYQCSFNSNNIKQLSHLIGHIETSPSLDNRLQQNGASVISCISSTKKRQSHNFKRGRFKCEYCNQKYNKLYDLVHHRLIHTGEKPHKCSECDKEYPRRNSLTRHYRKTHLKRNLLGTKKSSNHNLITSKVDYHVCDWDRCGRSFLNYSDFMHHTSNHLKEYRFQCSFDSDSIKKPSHLMGHIESLLSMDINSGCDNENVVQLPRNISDFNWKCYCFVRRLSITEMKNGFIERKMHNCLYCNGSFNTKIGFSNHIRTHGKNITIKSAIKKRFKCECCGSKFSRLCYLKQHIFGKKHTCNELVNKSNEVLNKLLTNNIEKIQRGKKERIQRTKKKPHKLRDDCNDNSFTAFSYTNSEREPLTKRRRFKVDYYEPDEEDTKSREVDKREQKKVLKIDYAENQNEFPCNECDLAFSSSIELKTHKKLSHVLLSRKRGRPQLIPPRLILKEPEKQEIALLEVPRKPGRPRLNPPTLLLNEPKKRGRPRLNESKSGTVLPKYYLCSYCNKTFDEPNALKLHIKTHIVTKQYSCSRCDKQFEEESNLLKHMRFHEKRKMVDFNKKYECRVCNNTFMYKGSLDLHMSSECGQNLLQEEKLKDIDHQSGKRLYICTWENCNKRYTQKSLFQYHMLVHKSEKPYKCSLCDKSFRAKGTAKKHFMKIHDPQKTVKTTDIGTGGSRNFQENSTVGYKNTNMEIIDLATIKIEKEEPDVIETPSTALPSNSLYDEAICKEELILFD